MAISLFLLVIIGLTANYFFFFNFERRKLFWKIYSAISLIYNFFYYYLALYPKVKGSVDKSNWKDHGDLFYLAIFETILLTIIGTIWTIKSRKNKIEKTTTLFGFTPVILKIIFTVLFIINLSFIAFQLWLRSIIIHPAAKEQEVETKTKGPTEKIELNSEDIEWLTYETTENRITLNYPSDAILTENLNGVLLHLKLRNENGIEISSEYNSDFNLDEYEEKRIKELDVDTDYYKFIRSNTKIINGYQFKEIEFQFPKLRRHLHEYVIKNDSVVYWIQTNSPIKANKKDIEMVNKIINSFQFLK